MSRGLNVTFAFVQAKAAATVCDGSKHIFFPRVTCYTRLFVCFSRRPNL